MKLHSLTKLCTNMTVFLCDALMMRSVFRTEFVFHIRVMNENAVTLAQFVLLIPRSSDTVNTVYNNTLDTVSVKSYDNEVI